MNKKYVYLIQSLDSGFYKIGVSKSPISRIKQLSTGNSSPLKIINVYLTELPYLIEKVLHNRYSHARLNNKEWFDLSIKEEAEFLNECARIEQGIKDLNALGNEFI